MNLTFNLSMVQFNKLVQGGKYKLQAGTLFHIEKFSIGNFNKYAFRKNKLVHLIFLDLICAVNQAHSTGEGG